jgi:hypothetical protein
MQCILCIHKVVVMDSVICTVFSRRVVEHSLRCALKVVRGLSLCCSVVVAVVFITWRRTCIHIMFGSSVFFALMRGG